MGGGGEHLKSDKSDRVLINQGVYEKQKYIKKPTQSKLLRCLVLVLAAVCLVLLCVLLSLVVMWYNERHTVLAQQQQQICLSCKSLDLSVEQPQHESPAFTRQLNKDEDDMQCCSQSSNVIDRLVDKYSKEKFNENEATRSFSMGFPYCKKGTTQKASARLSGISVADMKKQGSTDVIYWNDTAPSIRSGIRYKNGSLIVNQKGFYYIFSQIKLSRPKTAGYKTDTIKVMSDIDTILNQQVFIESGGKDRKVLESSKSVCETTMEHGETTISIGAVFELKTKDKVFVKTSHPQNLIPCEHSNFFGMYMT